MNYSFFSNNFSFLFLLLIVFVITKVHFFHLIHFFTHAQIYLELRSRKRIHELFSQFKFQLTLTFELFFESVHLIYAQAKMLSKKQSHLKNSFVRRFFSSSSLLFLVKLFFSSLLQTLESRTQLNNFCSKCESMRCEFVVILFWRLLFLIFLFFVCSLNDQILMPNQFFSHSDHFELTYSLNIFLFH